mgnify:CR=1 FL=1
MMTRGLMTTATMISNLIGTTNWVLGCVSLAHRLSASPFLPWVLGWGFYMCVDLLSEWFVCCM